MSKTIIRWLVATIVACSLLLSVILIFGWLLQNNETETRQLIEQLQTEPSQKNTKNQHTLE